MPPLLIAAAAAGAIAFVMRGRSPAIAAPSTSTVIPAAAAPATYMPTGGETSTGLTPNVVQSFAHPAAPASGNSNPTPGPVMVGTSSPPVQPTGLGTSAPYGYGVHGVGGVLTLPGMGTYQFATAAPASQPPMAAGSVYVAGLGEVPGPVPVGSTIGLSPGQYTPGGLPVGAGGNAGWAPGPWAPPMTVVPG
jgi:hypothetical protein